MNKRLLLFTVVYILACAIVDSQGDTGECYIRHSHSGAVHDIVALNPFHARSVRLYARVLVEPGDHTMVCTS